MSGATNLLLASFLPLLLLRSSRFVDVHVSKQQLSSWHAIDTSVRCTKIKDSSPLWFVCLCLCVNAQKDSSGIVVTKKKKRLFFSGSLATAGAGAAGAATTAAATSVVAGYYNNNHHD